MPAVAFDKPFLVPERNLVFTPDLPEYRQLLTAPAKAVTYQGHPLLAIPNDPAINHLLWMRGEQVPSPIYYSGYDWSFQIPFVTQIETAGMIVARRRSYVLSDLGVGKTLAALFAMDWLLKWGYVGKILVVAPLSILRSIWMDEVYKRMPRLKPVVLHGPRDERVALLNRKGWNVAIINPDGLKIMSGELIKQRFDLVVLDELATFRNHTTARWKSAQSILKEVPYATGLTGSPTPNGPWDAYGQARLMTPERLNGMSEIAFKEKVARQVKPSIWKARKGSEHIIYQLLQPAVRFRRSDVIELKGIDHHTITVDLSDDQKNLIERLKTHMIARYKEGIVKADNRAILVGKLLQAYGGAVYTKDKAIINLSPKARIATAETIIAGAAGKVLLFTAFTHVCEMVYGELRRSKSGSKYDGGNTAMVHGQTSDKERYQIFRSFQDANDPLRLIVAHPKCMSHGLNLTQADTIIWYMPFQGYETYQQANGRITRAGQTRQQMIYHLRASAVEDKVYNTLVTNGNMQATMLELFETEFA